MWKFRGAKISWAKWGEHITKFNPAKIIPDIKKIMMRLDKKATEDNAI